MRHGLALVLLSALLLGACSGDDDETTDGTDAASGTTGVSSDDGDDSDGDATECATAEADANRTVTVKVDDVVDGFGSLGSQTPSGLTPGSVRLAVEADEENEEPVDVTLSLGGETVAEVNGVEAGTTCGIDVDLEAGDYVVTSNRNEDQDAEFSVVAG